MAGVSDWMNHHLDIREIGRGREGGSMEREREWEGVGGREGRKGEREREGGRGRGRNNFIESLTPIF